MIEKVFLKARFKFTLSLQVTEHVHCMNSSKSHDEGGEGIWIRRLSVHKQKKKHLS